MRFNNVYPSIDFSSAFVYEIFNVFVECDNDYVTSKYLNLNQYTSTTCPTELAENNSHPRYNKTTHMQEN